MKVILQKMNRFVRVNRMHIMQAAIVAIFFAACAVFYYLGAATGSCSTTLATGPGDQTAGPIWLNSVVNKPLWGATDVTNAPYGENLSSPVLVTGTIQYVIFWVVSLFVGPVCGYNLYTTLALVFSAMTVYLFVRSITKRVDVAIFAGFAATFTPYMQSKIGVHPSYAFFGVFILALWLLVSLWRKPTQLKAVLLGLVVSTFFYIDPYFLLLGGVTIGMVLLGFLIAIAYRAINLRKQPIKLKQHLVTIRVLITQLSLTAIVVVLVGLAPLLIVRFKYGAQINAEVSSARSPIKQEARTYAARVPEYVWPATQNPYIGQIGGKVPQSMQRKPHGSNSAENTLSISFVVAILSTITLAVWAVSSVMKKETKFMSQEKLVMGVLFLVATGAFLVSLPPDFRGIPFASGVITDHITIWRVFARLQVVVAFSLAIVAAIGLSYFTRNLKRFARIIVVIIAIVLVGFEYLTFLPLSDNRSWTYAQVHPFYYWLKDQKDIRIIAEYPLNEPGQTSVTVSYFTDQYVHKKHVLNAARAASPQSVVRNSLRDISDPQVPGILSALGVDIVVIHAEDKKVIPQLPGLREVDWNSSPKDPDSIYTNGKLWVFKVTAKADSDGFALAPGNGFNELRVNSNYTSAESLFQNKAQLNILDIKQGGVTDKDTRKRAVFTANTTDQECDLKITQNNVVLWQGRLSKAAREIELSIKTKKPLILEKLNSNSENKISINNLNLL